MSIEIWHNPHCSKSRQALALLEQHNIPARVVLYLKAPPTRVELEQAHRLLNRPRACHGAPERPFISQIRA